MRRLGLLFAALALLLAGCGGTTDPGSGGGDFVPASVPLFVAINTDLDSSQWHTVNELANKFPDKQKAIDSIKQQLLKNGLDWDGDLKPALGPELDVVMLDFEASRRDRGADAAEGPGCVRASAVKKGNAADPSNKLVYKQFHGWTVISDKQAAIDAFTQASDSAKRTLSEDKNFTAAMDKAERRHLPRVRERTAGDGCGAQVRRCRCRVRTSRSSARSTGC